MCLKHPIMDSSRRLDWPACLQVFGNRPDQSPHSSPPTYPVAHSTGISKIPRLHKDVPSLRFQKCPFSAQAKSTRELRNQHFTGKCPSYLLLEPPQENCRPKIRRRESTTKHIQQCKSSKLLKQSPERISTVAIGALTGQLSSRYSETCQIAAPPMNLAGSALIGRSKTALNSAVVRPCRFRPAPFRCRFQIARSVRPSPSNLIRSAERDFLRLSGIGEPVILLDTIPYHDR
jgi:hypothetical protein